MKYDQVRPEDPISQVESAKTNRSPASTRSHRSSVVKLNEAKEKRQLTCSFEIATARKNASLGIKETSSASGIRYLKAAERI